MSGQSQRLRSAQSSKLRSTRIATATANAKTYNVEVIAISGGLQKSVTLPIRIPNSI